jgi:tetratricopeptide (TPR) repeat protein
MTIAAEVKPAPLKTFISYAHEDERLRDELVRSLVQLQRDGLIDLWHDRRIRAGDNWSGEIDQHLLAADVVLFLVSPDFLASGYCYDKEMAVALERHSNRQVRLVPIILRSSDWSNSPLKHLQALPEGALPVADWKDRDAAFLNIAQKLRETLAPASPVNSRKATPRRFTRALRRGPVALAVLVALCAYGVWFFGSSAAALVSEGNSLLNVGQYAESKRYFELALGRNPLSSTARLGRDTADLAALSDKPVIFEQRLRSLQSKHPRDPHLKVLEGDYYYASHEYEKAETAYQEAVNGNPHLAEGWFRLGVLWDQKGVPGESMEMYRRAVQESTYSPKYTNNLADLHFQRGEYHKALQTYQKISMFPLAALECARIHVLLNELPEALALQERAVVALQNTSQTSKADDQAPWYLKLDRSQAIRLTTAGEKMCFARLNLAATRFLRNDLAGSARTISEAVPVCGEFAVEIKALLKSHLARLAEEQPSLAKSAFAFSSKYLAN